MYQPFGSGLDPCDLFLSGALDPYGSLTLTETSPPQSFSEPLDITEMANYLRLPASMFDDPSMRDELNGFLLAARENAETEQNRDLVVRQWDLSYDYWMSNRIELRSPLRSVDLVQYRDSSGNLTTLTEGTGYIVDSAKRPAVIQPPYGTIWPSFTPWRSSAVLIRFTSGISPTDPYWNDTGARVKIGMKLLVKSWFNKEVLTEQQMAGIYALLSQGSISRSRLE